jgi:hypothetical protein
MDANHNNTISLDEFVSGMQEYAARSFPGTSDDYSVRSEERMAFHNSACCHVC